MSSSKQTRVSFGDVTVHELDDSATGGTTSASDVTLRRPMTAKSGMAAKKSIAKGALHSQCNYMQEMTVQFYFLYTYHRCILK